ncbi:hypothetical protein [Pyruvatibacter sp.]|uniref:hypothetical protein n=1 Tax=Pyruvatibacter sp. TaxID=1981328 RepID=UPI0032EC31B4
MFIRSPFMLGAAMGLMVNLAIYPAMQSASAQTGTTPAPSRPTSGPMPFPDPGLADELEGFPREVHEDIFGADPGTTHLPYDMFEQIDAPGLYPGVNADGEAFVLDVYDVLLTPADVEQAVIDEGVQVDPEDLQWIEDNQFEAVGVYASIATNLGAREVIAYQFTATTPEYGLHHVLMVAQDPEYFATPQASMNISSAGGGCENALQGVIDAFDCDGTIVVDQACVNAAQAAYDLAVAAAQADWAHAISKAIAAYNIAMDAIAVAKAALLAWRIATIAIRLVRCLRLASIPFVGSALAAACVILETARVIAEEIAKRAAIEAAKAAADLALQIAKDNADAILDAALDLACDALVAALNACLDCIEVEITPERRTVAAPARTVVIQ